MKILTASDIRMADQATTNRQNIRSIDLMERAANGLFQQITKDFPSFETSFVIFCGAGNNGGDGLALGRLLFQSGRDVRIFLYQTDKYSANNQENQERLQQTGIPIQFFTNAIPTDFAKHDVLIDALYGIGLSRPLAESWRAVIEGINASDRPILAIDIPSGLYSDQPSETEMLILKAHHTYTLQCPKMALLQPENAAYVGELTVVDIQLDASALSAVDSSYYFTTLDTIQARCSLPSRFAHKGTFGHALIVGGSYGKIGATHLSAKAALRTGCGMVSIYSAACANPILQTNFPEAMLQTDSELNHITSFPKTIDSYAAIGVGMGMGQHKDTKQTFFQFLRELGASSKRPKLVFDADALNLLAQHPESLSDLPPGSILTPHPKELQRLLGSWTDDWEKLEKTRAFAQQHQVVVLIKGANTAVVLPDGTIHFNTTGNWGMATAGSGDVLAGIITSLLAQGFSSKDAALTGVYLHGLAADLAVRTIHRKSLMASDIIDGISQAWHVVLPL
ncbi:NAD(P)H-hydrate dehydratase [Sphingobacterium corticibacter]|uniref:Bifunctional NAD(P)H-hydrate repair enzyme n=1 Tax=Sphingobacterium corticibacter TaxID=2171749 RepID=A0A2T8HMY6_9SPHI|nr:NAD(P)H-hydrate dehydratase [Sphingobacterium corticibacter]PVH26809.1 bifunctional ADP-dependent NAD(P)H-hydrate dehydratase/NAD(P)H-hydrate epimerase [Sphingobacterium corticibacter]